MVPSFSAFVLLNGGIKKVHYNDGRCRIVASERV